MDTGKQSHAFNTTNQDESVGDKMVDTVTAEDVSCRRIPLHNRWPFCGVNTPRDVATTDSALSKGTRKTGGDSGGWRNPFTTVEAIGVATDESRILDMTQDR